MKTEDFIKERIIEITETDVYGFIFAIKGCRLSYDSTDKMDSYKYVDYDDFNRFEDYIEKLDNNDTKLLKRLITKDDSECKFLRQIKVQCFIKAPRYWWIEFDTYKVGVVCQSESTMHTLKRLTQNFKYDESNFAEYFSRNTNRQVLDTFFDEYVGDTSTWFGHDVLVNIKASLPEGFLQKRAVDFNYGVLRTMYRQRKNHKLEEWQLFCEWIKTLPYSWLITGE